MSAEPPQPLASAGEPHRRSRARAWLGTLAGLALLIGTVFYVQPAALLSRMSQLRLGFIASGAALVVPQLICLSLRWQRTARQLGLPLSQRRALREYALSMLLNLLLPFGVAGDAVRVLRHAQVPATGPGLGPLPTASSGDAHASALAHKLGISSALQAVVLERVMGQMVLLVWVAATLPLWFGVSGAVLCAAALGALLLAVCSLQRLPAPISQRMHSKPVRALLQFSLALRTLLASPGFLVSQVLLSSAVMLGLAAQLACALWALDLSLSVAQAARVFPLMLLSMSVPLSFAGFGLREAVTAQLYRNLQLSAADGAAFALAFGAMTLCSTVPCLALVLWLPDRNLDRTRA